MMKLSVRRYIIGFIFSTILISAYFGFTGIDSDNDSPLNQKYSMAEQQAGNAERMQFQFNRLKDPKTNSLPPDIRIRDMEFAQKIAEENKLRINKQTSLSREWVPEGPINQGGRTKAIVVDYNNPDIVLAASAEAGVWRSEDGGNNWVQTTDPSFIQNVNCLTQDIRIDKYNIWYYGTGELRSNTYLPGNGFNSLLGDGIYKSVDNGKTWKPLTNTVFNRPHQFNFGYQIVWDVVVDRSAEHDRVYAAIYGGVVVSNDGGETWTSGITGVGTFGLDAIFTSVSVTEDGTAFAALSSGANSGIHQSFDYGVTWNDITPDFWPAQVNRIETAVTDDNPFLLYVVANTPAAGNPGSGSADDYMSLWRYNYLYDRWEDLSDKLPDFIEPATGFTSQQGYDLFIEASWKFQNQVFIGGTNLYRSMDAFATKLSNKDWIGGYSRANDFSHTYKHHADQHALFVSYLNPYPVYSAHDGGISKTEDIQADSVVWKALNYGYVTTQFWNVAIEQKTANDPLIIGGMQDNGTRIDEESNRQSNWTPIWGGDGAFAAISDGGKYRYVSSQNGHVYRLNEAHGGTFVQPADAENFLFITPFELDPFNTDAMYLLAGNQVWRNSNLTEIEDFNREPTSKNWSVFTNTVNGSQATALAMAPSTPNMLYVGDNRGSVYKILNSTNVSTPFIDITGPDFPGVGYVTSIDVNPTNSNKVMVAFSNYQTLSLFYSSDGGASWSNVGGNLESNNLDGSGAGPSIRCVKILPGTDGTEYFTGTSIGLFSTTQLNGTNTIWLQEAPNKIGNMIVESIDARYVDGKVVVGTFGKGVFSSSITTTDVASEQTLPGSFQLKQNYPNPFNPTTVIEYSVPKDGFVNLAVYNSIGERVANLENNYKSAGSYNASFDAENLASGIYVYRLDSEGFSLSKKMVLLR